MIWVCRPYLHKQLRASSQAKQPHGLQVACEWSNPVSAWDV